MKKFISGITVIVMLCAFNTTAFAATLDGNTKSESHDVVAKYNDSVATPTVYSVNVKWGAMEFTYNVGGTRNWNATDHSYTDNSSAKWSVSGNTVTVTNHSNIAIEASFNFDVLDSYKTLTGVFDKISVSLPSAQGKATDDISLSGTAKLTVGGLLASSIESFTKVGEVTVTIN